MRVHFESEITNVQIPDNLPNPEFVGADKLKMEMATRMIFSGLVDADFLDKEKHYQNNRGREPLKLDAELLLSLLAKLEAARLKKSKKRGRKMRTKI